MIRKKDYMMFGIELQKATLNADEVFGILNKYKKKELENVLFAFSVANVPVKQIADLILSKNNFFSCSLFDNKDEEKKFFMCREVLCDLLFPITLVSPTIALYILENNFGEKEINIIAKILNVANLSKASIKLIEADIKSKV